MVTRDTTSATEALQLMVQRHFRHLVCHLITLNIYIFLILWTFFSLSVMKKETSSVFSISTRSFRRRLINSNVAPRPPRNSTVHWQVYSLNSVTVWLQTRKQLPCCHMSRLCAKRPLSQTSRPSWTHGRIQLLLGQRRPSVRLHVS